MKKVILLIALLMPAAAAGQSLRVEGAAGSRTYESSGDGVAAVFPLSAVAQLGGSFREDAAGAVITLFGDSIRVWRGSPFVRAGTRLVQLALPAASRGELRMPEQFFVQTLPAAYPARIEYRAGAVRVIPPTVAVAPADTPPRTVAPDTPARTVAPPVRADPPRTARSAPAKRIVVIDPGHGGKDPGTAGANGLWEAPTVLQVSTRLANLLRSRGYVVHMTRTTDTFITLAERPRMANRWMGSESGALFISIHANSHVPSARGFETFFLSDASTEDERRVAEMENSVVKYEQRTAGSELDQVLNGLRNDFYLRASHDFATTVQRQMAQFHPGPNRGVKRAPFRVLVGALMPAVLFEIGFITNASEAALLGTAAFQDKLAFGLAAAVDQFYREHEPLWVEQ